MKKTFLLLLLISGFNSQAQVTDIDGNSYDTIRIGTQTWMAENLNVSRFRNGDIIFEAKTTEDWIKAGENQQPAWCYYDFNPNNGDMYGKLYNWHAVNDSRGIAKEGWHVPSDEEWSMLTDYLGGEDVAGRKMKSISGWPENGNGTNESGFSGLPGGILSHLGTFDDIGVFASYWLIPDGYSSFAWNRYLYYDSDSATGTFYNLGRGFSVRCVKD